MNKGTVRDLFKKLRKYEIFIRKAITNQMQGDFHSVFKGSGITFDDVRAYQYGDDIRTIDWNASAKGHGVFVKTFREEREQQVYFLLDVSASQEIGDQGKQKVDVGKEICGVLGLSAIREGSQVGLICYSDRKEKFIKPGKGEGHAYKLVSGLYDLKPASRKTDLNRGIYYALNMIKKRSLVIFVSDFIDEGFMKSFKALAKRHDLIVIHLADSRETDLPSLGIVPIVDKESGKTLWVNSSSQNFKQNVTGVYRQNSNELKETCGRYQVNYLPINTDQDYVPKLINLFQTRNRSRKSG